MSFLSHLLKLWDSCNSEVWSIQGYQKNMESALPLPTRQFGELYRLSVNRGKYLLEIIHVHYHYREPVFTLTNFRLRGCRFYSTYFGKTPFSEIMVMLQRCELVPNELP
jgi:hypothetical protein